MHGGEEFLILRHGKTVQGVILQRVQRDLVGEFTVHGAGIGSGLLQRGENGGILLARHSSAPHSFQHFVAQSGIVDSRGAAGREEAKGLKRQRRFFDVNILADEGAERKIGQHGREVGDHFLIETGADLHRRHKDAQHANVGVGDLADGLDGFQHHVIALDGVLVHLDGDENILNGDQHVDVKKAFERRGAVEEYKIVCIGKLRQQAAQ